MIFILNLKNKYFITIKIIIYHNYRISNHLFLITVCNYLIVIIIKNFKVGFNLILNLIIPIFNHNYIIITYNQ